MARSARRMFFLSFVLVAGLCAVLIGPAREAAAQGTSLSATVPAAGEIQLQAVPVGMPPEPASVRLLRIRVVPGGKIPLNTHPGPEYFAIEAGTLTLHVNGKASIVRGNPPKAEAAPDGKDFTLTVGDQIVLETNAQLAYSNAGKEPAVILAAVILPIGHQHPPGITYVSGTPGPNDIVGVSFQVLGDGVADTLPKTASFIIDRLILGPGQPIPASPDPLMLVSEAGTLPFKVTGGDVEVSTLTNPGLQPPAAQGSQFHIAEGDALFFPHGMAEVTRPTGGDTLVLLRASIVAAPNAGTPIPNDPLLGKITVVNPSVTTPTPQTTTPTPAATATAAASTATKAAATATPPSAATATPAPTKPAAPTATATPKIAVGATVTATDSGVNLREQPTTSGAIVTQLTKGEVLKVIGGPQTADGFTWWQVQDPNTGVTGWAAQEFLTPQS